MYEKMKAVIKAEKSYLYFDSRTDKDFKDNCYGLTGGEYRLSNGCCSRTHVLDANDNEMFLTYMCDEDYNADGSLKYKQASVVLYAPFLNLKDEKQMHFFIDHESNPTIERVGEELCHKLGKFTAYYGLAPEPIGELVADFAHFIAKVYRG